MSDAPERTYTWNRKTFPISRPDLDDWAVAGKVRMLMREQLDHEAVCVLARDPIMCLVAEKEAQAARIAALKAERDKLSEAVDMEATRLAFFCSLVNAGKAQGGGREFSKQIGFAFDRIRAALAETEGK